MTALRIRAFLPDDIEAVVALWETCGLTRPWNDPRLDIARKSTTQPELFLVGTIEGVVVATAMAGYDGHRGWVNCLAVAPRCRLGGHARALMREAERLLALRGCPKLNLQLRRANTAAVGFYRALGYVEDDVVCFGKRLIVDPPTWPHVTTADPIDTKGAIKMDKQPNAINWFEIPVDDFARAKMFYSRIFDYEMPEMDMGPSHMGMLPFEQGDGRVGGAIVKTEDFLPARQGTLVYLNGGEDLIDVLLRVDAAGGKVLTDKTEITPELGYYAVFLDSEGNKVALHSPK